MPLSEHEQRLLEQMERALYAEDPKFATSMRGVELRSQYRKRLVVSAFGFLAGVALLMAGPITRADTAVSALLGLAGFVVMLGSVVWAVQGWRRAANGELTDEPQDAAQSAPTLKSVPKPEKSGFMTRVEDRWRRRRDDLGH